MPKTLTHGRWNEGNVGNLNFGNWKDMCGIGGMPHRIVPPWMPPQPGQPTRTGMAVEVPSSSVLIHVLAVHEDSVTAPMENPGGTVVIVEMIVSESEEGAAALVDAADSVDNPGELVVAVAVAVGRVIDDGWLAVGRVARVGCPSGPIESAGNVKGGGRIMFEDG
jgi:hypothetical protein